MAKAGLWAVTDAEERKHGERTGLDTLVVHAVNVGHQVWGTFHVFRAVANALSAPPGEYGRKAKTQRNSRGPARAAVHVDEFDATRRALPGLDIYMIGLELVRLLVSVCG